MTIFQNKIDINKNTKNLRKYSNISKYEDIKYFYLIDKDLIKKIISQNNFEIFNSINNFDEIPKNFEIIEKNEDNELIIKKANLQDKIFQYKILFMDGYFGIINDTKYIVYFYLIIKGSYSPKYIINYKSEDMMINDIENNILPKGIANYISETGIGFSNTKTSKLFNKELELIGVIINLKNKKHCQINYNDILEISEESNYYVALMQCLVNLIHLKNIFLNREFLFNEKIIQDYKKVTKFFYEIMKYIWKNNDGKKKKDYILSFYVKFKHCLILIILMINLIY